MPETIHRESTVTPPELLGDVAEAQDFARHNAMLDAVQDVLPQGEWTDGQRNITTGVETVIDPYYNAPDIRIPTGNVLPDAVTNIVYGQVVVGEGSETKDQICDLDTVTKINETLQATVLAGEHGHIPRVLMPPNPDDITGDPKNVDVWLHSIGYEDTWPVMLQRSQTDGKTKPFSHDESDYHLGNFALFPVEMQDALSEAARHTYEFRQTHPDGNRTLVLPSEDARQDDPLAFNLRGGPTGPGYRGGIDVIDNISDNNGYMGLLSYLATQPESTLTSTFEDLVLMADGLRSGELTAPEWDSGVSESEQEKWEMAQDLNVERMMIGDVTNFNMRHREGRSITQEEWQKAGDKYLKGILRVAMKIRSDETTADIPVVA